VAQDAALLARQIAVSERAKVKRRKAKVKKDERSSLLSSFFVEGKGKRGLHQPLMKAALFVFYLLLPFAFLPLPY
jgi:hypothetical protein